MKRLLRTASLRLLLMSLTLVACHPDEDPTSYVAQKNVNINPDKAYARRLEMPHLDNNNRFITHSTIYKGEETVTYSLEYDDAKHHSKWVAFQCYDVVNEKHWYRSNWYNTPWGGDPFQADPNLPSNVCPDRRVLWQWRRARSPLRIRRSRLFARGQRADVLLLEHESHALRFQRWIVA